MTSFADKPGWSFPTSSLLPICTFLINIKPSKYPFANADFLDSLRSLFNLRLLSPRILRDWDSIVPSVLLTYVRTVLNAPPSITKGEEALHVIKTCYGWAEGGDLDLNYSVDYSLCLRYRDVKRAIVEDEKLRALRDSYLFQGGNEGDGMERGEWKLDEDVFDPPYSINVSADVDLFQRISWLNVSPENYLPTGVNVEGHTHFAPSDEMIGSYDDLCVDFVESMSEKGRNELRKNMQDYTAFRGFFSIKGDFTKKGEETRQKILQSNKYPPFFGMFNVYNQIGVFHLYPFLRIYRTGGTYLAVITEFFKRSQYENFIEATRLVFTLSTTEDSPFTSGHVYRLNNFGSTPENLLWPRSGVNNVGTEPGEVWAGFGIEEAPSLIDFMENYVYGVRDGRIGTTDFDLLKVLRYGQLEPPTAIAPDLFKVRTPPRETEGINVEVSYIQYDFMEFASSQVAYAYSFKLWTEGLDYDVQLLSRHWRFEDSEGGVQVVDGEGVIGMYPILHNDGSYSEKGRHYPRDKFGPFSYQSCTGNLDVVKMTGHLRFKIIEASPKCTVAGSGDEGGIRGTFVDAYMPELEFKGGASPTFLPVQIIDGNKMWSN
mmetsp:Transcript_17751/g.36883  ORF Transcript_17751/g.36883 Transcript_17751/m.36883 type:complete len:600 (-) Transcript_17751:52-1851(-)